MDELNKSVTQIDSYVDKIKYNHNVILASVQNNEVKDETNDLMTKIKKISHKVHGGLKREDISNSVFRAHIGIFGGGGGGGDLPP